MKNQNRITKQEVVQNLKSGTTTTVNACRHLRKMGRYTANLTQNEKKRLHSFDQKPLDKISVEQMPAYAALLLKSVPREASAERPKPTPKPRATVVAKKPTPRGKEYL